MMDHLIILFVLLPMTAGILSIFLHRWRRWQQWTGLALLGANALAAVVALATVSYGPSPHLVSQMGNWPAPFGISIVVDPLAAIMLAATSIVSLAVYIYCLDQLPARFSGGYFHALFHLLIFGVQWSFITADLFNLFVAFEIMLMASYAMFCISTSRPQIRQAYKYILLNLVGSTLFVTCAGLLYALWGTLNIADIARIAATGQIQPAAVPVIAMLLIVFALKTAIFPLWYWLPDTYHTLPGPIGGLFAGLLTKVGAYVLIRILVMTFGTAASVTSVFGPLLVFSAGVTMFVGVLGAVSMHSVRRILAIHIISQVGYMIMGIGMAMTSDSDELRLWATAGAIFFIVHNMVVKCCLFLAGGLMAAHAGSDDLNQIGGLLKRAPWLAVLFLIAALSLAGLPPLSGFFGKFILIKEAMAGRFYLVGAVALATSLLTLLSMLKIFSYGFWSTPQGRHVSGRHRPRTTAGMTAVVMLVVAAVSMGPGAQFYLDLSLSAARRLVDPGPYIEAVLGPAARLPRVGKAPEPAGLSGPSGRLIQGTPR